MATKFQIVMEDECLAAWMPINNTFTKPAAGSWSALKNFQDGLLIQVGCYIDAKTDKPVEDIFGGITFEKGGKELPDAAIEDPRKPYWINIIAGKAAPMRKSHLPLLCKGLRRHFQLCRPQILITCWQGEQGYRISNSPRFLDFHRRFTFTLNDPVRVEVNEKEIAGVEKMTIHLATGHEGGLHGPHQDPPW